MGKRRTIHARWIRDETFHVEGPGFVANFTTGLRNRYGQEVVAVSIAADGDKYRGDPEWWAVVEGKGLTPEGVGFRIVKYDEPERCDECSGTRWPRERHDEHCSLHGAT